MAPLSGPWRGFLNDWPATPDMALRTTCSTSATRSPTPGCCVSALTFRYALFPLPCAPGADRKYCGSDVAAWASRSVVLVQTRTWHVTVDVVFPNHFALEVDDAGRVRPPQQLTPQSRIPVGRRQLGGADVFVYKGEKQTAPPSVRDDLRFSLGHVSVRLVSAAPGPFAAIQEAVPIFDLVLESMSFQMQAPLQIVGADAIDLSGTPAVGEDREFGQWSGLTLPTFRPTALPMQSLSGRVLPDLDLDLPPSDRRANRALDWYLKALVAPYEADHFIFLWIACEVLAADSDFAVSGPYRGPCGHDIQTCPDCGAATTRHIQGPSMERWLDRRVRRQRRHRRPSLEDPADASRCRCFQFGPRGSPTGAESMAPARRGGGVEAALRNAPERATNRSAARSGDLTAHGRGRNEESDAGAPHANRCGLTSRAGDRQAAWLTRLGAGASALRVGAPRSSAPSRVRPRCRPGGSPR